VRERWFSGRAVSLHVAALIFVPGCALAAWWQVTRAADGNQLSYLYMIMWPVFGLLGIFFWWLLVHTDYDTVGLKGMRNRQTSPDGEATASVPIDLVAAASPVAAAPTADSAAPAADSDTAGAATAAAQTVAPPGGVAPDMDPELVAYNARLAQLAHEGPKTWRRPERVVARRTQ
jgi:hypothetical protein